MVWSRLKNWNSRFKERASSGRSLFPSNPDGFALFIGPSGCGKKNPAQ